MVNTIMLGLQMFITRLLRNFLHSLIDKSKGQFIRGGGVRLFSVFVDANYFSSGQECGVRHFLVSMMFAQARQPPQSELPSTLEK